MLAHLRSTGREDRLLGLANVSETERTVGAGVLARAALQHPRDALGLFGDVLVGRDGVLLPALSVACLVATR